MNIDFSAFTSEFSIESSIPPISRQDYARKSIEWYNDSVGSLDGADCQICKNKGNIAHLNADGYEVLTRCSCMNQRELLWGMKRNGFGDLAVKCRFDNFKVSDNWQEFMKKEIGRYFNSPDGAWLFVAGQSGCGKTHLCTAMCSHFARLQPNLKIKYVHWKDILYKSDSLKFKDAEFRQFRSELKAPDLLYIDDFLKNPSGQIPLRQELSVAYDIINDRYTGGSDSRTVITTEYSLQQIVEFDTALGGRIAERSKGYRVIVENKKGRNYRIT